MNKLYYYYLTIKLYYLYHKIDYYKYSIKKINLAMDETIKNKIAISKLLKSDNVKQSDKEITVSDIINDMGLDNE